MAELIDMPAAGALDASHLKAIRRHIFQDVYDWAGAFRTVNMSKGGIRTRRLSEPALRRIQERPAAENHLAGLDAATFATRAAC
jgi:cell filamentation protein